MTVIPSARNGAGCTMAKAILRIFGWLSILAGTAVILYALSAFGTRGIILFVPTAASFLLAGVPLVALAEIVELLRGSQEALSGRRRCRLLRSAPQTP